MTQRRKIVLSIALTLVLALCAITVRLFFLDTSPARGEMIQVVTSTAPADTGYDDDDYHHDERYGDLHFAIRLNSCL